VGVRPKESTLSCEGWSNLREFKELKEAVALVFIGPVMATFVYLPVCWPLIARFHCVLQGFIYLFIYLPVSWLLFGQLPLPTPRIDRRQRKLYHMETDPYGKTLCKQLS
jgi:hypothetical protein